MFKKHAPEKKPIDHAIDATFDAYHPEDDDAMKTVKLLKGLHSLKNQDDKPWYKRVNPDTALLVSGNLVGILMIVGHERAHVVTSKALQFVKSAR